MMRAAIYARVSTEDQAKHGYSLDEQREACTRRARELGAAEILECVDDGYSGSILDRPGLEQLREAVREKAIDLVVIRDPDRLSRKLTYQLLLTDEIEKAGIRLEFLDFTWQDTPEGRLFYSIRGAIAEYEKEKIKERSLRGKRQKARQGGIATVPHQAYGYTYNRETKTLEINPAEAEIVRRIFDLFLNQGLGTDRIARLLAAEGIPTKHAQVKGQDGTLRPAGWHRATVIRILRNEMYCGRYHQMRWNSERAPLHAVERPRDEWITVDCPAIIDRMTWERAQEQIAKNRDYRGRNVRREYLLRGLLYCGLCGRRLSGGSWRQHFVYYSCGGKRPGSHRAGEKRVVCPTKYHRAADLERAVWSRLVEFLRRPEAYLAELKACQERGEEARALEGRLAEIREKLEALRQHKLQLISFRKDGLLSPEELARVLADDNKMIQALEEERAALEARISAGYLAEAEAKGIKEYAQRLAKRADNLSFQERRHLVNLLVKCIVVGADGGLVIYGYLPDKLSTIDAGRLVSSSHAESYGGL